MEARNPFFIAGTITRGSACAGDSARYNCGNEPVRESFIAFRLARLVQSRLAITLGGAGAVRLLVGRGPQAVQTFFLQSRSRERRFAIA
jgi:hypothetical protein